MVEVIDLLSSPEPPRPAICGHNMRKTGASKALRYETTKLANNDWFNLSPDKLSTLPPFAKAPSTSAKPSLMGKNIGRPARNIGRGKRSNDFDFLSDDFDSTIGDISCLSPPKLPATKSSKVSTGPASNWNTTSKSGQSTSQVKDNDFYLLSEDAESVVNLDDPFASDPPSPKRRRLSSAKPAAARSTGFPSLGRSKTTTVLDSDPIVCTSSPDPFADTARRRKPKEKEIFDALDEDDRDDILGLEPPKSKINGKGIATGSGILESSNGKKLNAFLLEDLSEDDDLPDIVSLTSKPGSKSSKRPPQTALTKYYAEKAKEKALRDKAEKANEKAAAKEAEKDRKRLAKEEKSREKEKAADLAKVNTVRTDKKVSTPEMIVDLPSCLDSKLTEQVQTFLGKYEVEYSKWDSSQPIVKWRRKVVAEYNDEAGHWQPVAPRIKPEKHVICVMNAKDFVDLATGDESQDFNTHVLRLKAKFDGCEVIYLIEGLMVWMRKNRNLKNRQFTEAVRSHLSQEAPTTNQKTRKKKEQDYVDEDLIEDALLRLQAIHGALIHQTNAVIETAEWIFNFTQHISTIPYKYATPAPFFFSDTTANSIPEPRRHHLIPLSAWNPDK
jgi:crossover junction endonuclease EME1